MPHRTELELGSITSSALAGQPTYGISYLSSRPGAIRATNVVLGVLSLILVIPGFPNDFSEEYYEEIYEPRQGPRYRLTRDGVTTYSTEFYGHGYVTEHPNTAQIVCITTCLTFSAFLLLCLLSSPGWHNHSKSRGYNRFLNLTAAFLQGVGVLNGIFGLLLMRGYCCHVEFMGSERHVSQMEGYRAPCLCYFTPLWADNTVGGVEYSSLYYHDVPDDVRFHTAFPHHFIPRVIALVLMMLNGIAYLLASVNIG